MNDTSELTGTKLGNYRLERILGRGRMGVVYLAHDEALLRQTAVKLLSWQASDLGGQNPEAWFLAEARSVARINHPNVVQIYGVARQGSTCYIAMEYVAGGSVDTLVARHGPLPAARATALLVQCADALQAAHDVGIVHRDVKPENVLISAHGNAKLGDFGMALRLAKARPNEPARAGTPFYTAPEIWQGHAASPATDLYALGATYFFMLTGRVPYPAHDLPSLIQAHIHAEVPDASAYSSKVPKTCDLLLRKCLAKSPRERFTSARTLATEARSLLDSLEDASSAAGLRSEIRSLDLQEALNLVALHLDSHPGLLVTPDARLLIAYFGLGDPGRTAALLDHLLSAAQATQNRLLTTWDVWAIQFASTDAVGESGLAESERPARPSMWPTPRVLEILNQCRKQCGIPPRPSASECN